MTNCYYQMSQDTFKSILNKDIKFFIITQNFILAICQVLLTANAKFIHYFLTYKSIFFKLLK